MRRPPDPGQSEGRPERLPTGPYPCTKSVLQSHVGSCHSKTTTVRALYNGEITEGKRVALSFCDHSSSAPAHVVPLRDDSVTVLEAQLAHG
jgi:hypothetical protein